MKQAITIGTVTAGCGEKVRGKLLAGEFSTGTEVYLPFILINGKEDGNTVWVNACAHGNELNGVLAAQKLARELRPEDVKGAVIITPICNPLAFREKKGFPSSKATQAWAKTPTWERYFQAGWTAA